MRALLILLFASLFFSCSPKPSPHNLNYPLLEFTPPSLAGHRHALNNGMVVFILEDPKVPVFDIHVRVRASGLIEEKKGLAMITADLLEEGGLLTLPADSLDELLEFHAISLGTNSDLTVTIVSASSIKEKAELTLDLFNRMLREPAFEEKKLALIKQRYVESIRHRFDSPKGALSVLAGYAFYGRGRKSDLLSEKDVQSITREDIVRFYKAHYRPENMILGVSGRFETRDLLDKLNATLGTWTKSGVPETVLPNLIPDFKPGLYFLEKEVNQSSVRVGLPVLSRPHPDYYPLVLMNFVVGGAAFTSRICKKVREEEGLAYSAGSSFSADYFFPGLFYGYLETKSASTAYAISLTLAEIRKFVETGATGQELAEAKQSLIDAFPSGFNTGDEAVRAFTRNQYVKESDSLFDAYRNRIQAITLDEVQAVAKKYLVPEKMAFCVVGKYSECANGDEVHAVKLADFGTPIRLTEKELNQKLGGE